MFNPARHTRDVKDALKRYIGQTTRKVVESRADPKPRRRMTRACPLQSDSVAAGAAKRTHNRFIVRRSRVGGSFSRARETDRGTETSCRAISRGCDVFYNPRVQSARKSDRDGDRMTHNASAAAAAAAAMGKRNEKGTTMHGPRAIIFSFNGQAEREERERERETECVRFGR